MKFTVRWTCEIGKIIFVTHSGDFFLTLVHITYPQRVAPRVIKLLLSTDIPLFIEPSILWKILFANSKSVQMDIYWRENHLLDQSFPYWYASFVEWILHLFHFDLSTIKRGIRRKWPRLDHLCRPRNFCELLVGWTDSRYVHILHLKLF